MFHRRCVYSLVGLLFHFALVTIQATTVTINVRNDSASGKGFRVEWSGNGGSTWNGYQAGSISAGNLSTDTNPGWNGTHQLRVEWYDSGFYAAIGAGDKLGVITPGVTVYSVPASGSVTVDFYYNGTTPTYRLDFYLDNQTFSTHSYQITRTDTGATLATLSQVAGASYTFSVTNVTALYPVQVTSTDGSWPPFSQSISATPGDYWRLMDGSLFVPATLSHVYLPGPDPSTNSVEFTGFNATNPPASSNLTEGTYKAGTVQLINLARDQGEKEAVASSNLSAKLDIANANLASISNSAKAFTNSSGSTATIGQATNTGGSVASAPVTSPYTSWSPGVTVGSWGTDSSAATIDEENWTYTLPLVGTIDINPLHSDTLGPIAPISRNLFIWASAIALILACAHRAQGVMTAVGNAPQGSGPSVEVAGTGGNWLTSIAAILAILAVVAAIPALWVAFKSANTTVFSYLGVDPLSWLPGSGILLAYVPLDVMLAHFAIGVTFQFGAMAAQWIAQMGIRVIPGS